MFNIKLIKIIKKNSILLFFCFFVIRIKVYYHKFLWFRATFILLFWIYKFFFLVNLSFDGQDCYSVQFGVKRCYWWPFLFDEPLLLALTSIMCVMVLIASFMLIMELFHSFFSIMSIRFLSYLGNFFAKRGLIKHHLKNCCFDIVFCQFCRL